ncbi:DUF58 domain-containing protein [Alicyclobacillus sendaiensis]|uniref:DUF58 domain-containing protein n=1 Tax=Alicyclobacillus sendaiensis TaxID=192387 RepID=UPI0026F44A03|nr:DUF58 domain-containing protein [Alicyclobacillus sendaiensis]
MTTRVRRPWLLMALLFASVAVTSLALGTGQVGLRALGGALDALCLYELSVVTAAIAISNARAELPPRAFAGESVRIAVEIATRARGVGKWERRAELSLEWEGHREPSDAVNAVAWRKWREGCRVELEACSLRRGRYALSAVRVLWADAFGLVAVERRLPVQRAIAVYPKLVPVDDWVGEIEQRIRAQGLTAREADMAPTGGVAPYRPGERLSLMHWPTSLRTGDLYAREMAAEGLRPWRIVPWIRPGDPPHAAERALSVVLSIFVYGRRRGLPMECVIPAGQGHRPAWRRCRTLDEAGVALADIDLCVGTAPRGADVPQWPAAVYVTAGTWQGREPTRGGRALVVSAADG